MGALLCVISLGATSHAASRTIRAQNITLPGGQTNRVYLVLEGQGDEGALGFSLSFNTNLLAFVDAVAGLDSTNTGASLNVNTSQIANGRVGLALGLFPGNAFPAGTNIIAEILFTPAATATSTVSAVSFTNQPVVPEVSDAGPDGEAHLLPVTLVGASVTIQMPCTYSLNTNAASFTATGGPASVVLSTAGNCPWTVENSNSWIAISSATNGTGSMTLNYSVASNIALSARAGVIRIGGQNLNISQQALVCSYALSATSQTNAAGASTNSVAVTAAGVCSWSVTNTIPWLTILSGTNGSGTGVVTYALQPNGLSSARSGTFTIAGQNVAVTQQGISCTYSVSPAGRGHGFGAESNFFTVGTGSTGCLWGVVNTNPWIAIVSGAGAPGGGNVGYTVDPNPFFVARIGTVTVEGRTFVVTQQAFTCSYTLSPSNAAHVFGASTGTVLITTSSNCSWSATTSNSWIALSANTNGTGSGSFNYSVAANSQSVARTGTIAVASQIFTVTQAGFNGSFSFAPLSLGATGQVTLRIVGDAPVLWELQMSPDLMTWVKVADLTNSTGEVVYVHPGTPTATNRFFRALLR